MADLHVVDIDDGTVAARAEVIRVLEDALELAKDGTLVEIVMVGILDTEQVRVSYTPTMDMLRRLGALELAKHDVGKTMDAENE